MIYAQLAHEDEPVDSLTRAILSLSGTQKVIDLASSTSRKRNRPTLRG